MLGAAGNVARNVAALGARGRLVGVVGKDGARQRGAGPARRRDRGSRASWSPTADRPTTVKTRFVSAGQQLLRVDEETDARRSPARSSSQLMRAIADAAHGRRRDPALRLRQGRRHRGGDRGLPRRGRARGRGADRRLQGPLVRPLRRGRRHQAQRRRARPRHRPADRDRRRGRGGAGPRAGALRTARRCW